MLHGSHFDCAKMLIESRSHQLGKGQSSSAEMPCVPHPSRPVYGSQRVSAEMSHCTHSHQLGEGQAIGAAMPLEICPSRSVYGGQKSATGTSPRHRLHQLGEGQKSFATMPKWSHPPQLVLRRPRRSSRKVSHISPPKGRVRKPAQKCHMPISLPN